MKAQKMNDQLTHKGIEHLRVAYFFLSNFLSNQPSACRNDVICNYLGAKNDFGRGARQADFCNQLINQNWIEAHREKFEIIGDCRMIFTNVGERDLVLRYGKL